MIKLLKSHPFFSDKTIDSCTLLKHQGYCNENYLVLAEGKKYIARKFLRNDIDRVFEYKVQLLAFEQGITAESLVFDEENSFMLFEFLEGRHQNELDKKNLKLLASTLQKLHTVKIDTKPIQIMINNKTNEVLDALEIIENYPKEYVLCHNDINSQNIFFSDEAKLIDWEYAGVNDKYFDLASVCVEFNLDTKEEMYFLEHYFDISEEIYEEKLRGYKAIYKALCVQWFEALEITPQ